MFVLNQTEKLLLGICILVPLLVIVNLGLWSAFRRRHDPGAGNPLRMPGKTMNIRRPWREEDENLQELSRRVDELHHPDRPSHHDNHNGET